METITILISKLAKTLTSEIPKIFSILNEMLIQTSLVQTKICEIDLLSDYEIKIISLLSELIKKFSFQLENVTKNWKKQSELLQKK
ncbi:hypothetical protein [Metamycoplasma equirhinis]|uniref:hypothetical protein n=1 Tax=Metamycoplasma equirhinis TaxID=92402 RepID=UPI00359405B4